MPQNTDTGGDEPRPEGIEELSPEIDPPAMLEERVVRALRREGLVRAEGAVAARRPLLGPASLAAGLILAVALGFAGGRLTAGAPGGSSEEADYVLLVRPGPDGSAPPGGEEEMRRFHEYSRWYREMAARGAMVGGEKLEDKGGFVLAGEAPGDTPVREEVRAGTVEGYFLIRAADDEEAARIASTCPHLKYGGALEIRRIDKLEERS